MKEIDPIFFVILLVMNILLLIFIKILVSTITTPKPYNFFYEISKFFEPTINNYRVGNSFPKNCKKKIWYVFDSFRVGYNISEPIFEAAFHDSKGLLRNFSFSFIHHFCKSLYKCCFLFKFVLFLQLLYIYIYFLLSNNLVTMFHVPVLISFYSIFFMLSSYG